MYNYPQLNCRFCLRSNDLKQGLSLLLSLGYLTISQGISLQVATAQITPDNTTNSKVDVSGNDFTINQGDRAGNNLFHSFSDFSVPTDGSAFFNNAADVVNIFSRVTGGNISNIDGLLGANGTANLFLINPAGIIFGEGARLDLGGSFYGSTADSILFSDGEFSATDLDNPPLLTINAPIGLNFRDNPGDITNRSRTLDQNSQSLVGLQVQPGKTLALIGGNLNFNGGILTSPGGSIELGSISSSGVVGINETTENSVFGYRGIAEFGNIQLQQQALVDSSGSGGGGIHLQGKQITLEGNSQISSTTIDSISGADIALDTNNLIVKDGSSIAAFTIGSETGGNLTVRASESVELVGVGFETLEQNVIIGFFTGRLNLFQEGTTLPTGLLTSTNSSGQSGTITIDTPSLSLSEGAALFSPTFDTGNGGIINIENSQQIEVNSSFLATMALINSTGNAGNINIATERLIVSDGSLLTSATFGTGDGGNIVINALDSVESLRAPANLFIQTGIYANSVGSIGKAGDITINTKRLIAQDGASIGTGSGANSGEIVTVDVGGPAGELEINASESIEVSGISETLLNGTRIVSFLSTATGTDSPAGKISINTKKLILRNGGLINSGTGGAGDAGLVTINASESVQIIGTSIPFDSLFSPTERIVPSKIEASSGNTLNIIVNGTTGNAGNLTINTGELVIEKGGELRVDSIGSGNAGDLEVQANSIKLDGGSIIGETRFGSGGNLNLNIKNNITLVNNSLISGQAFEDSDGGNLDIGAQFVVAFPEQNNDIIASAELGQGGNINITAESLFGLEERPLNDVTNDINASSDFGLDGSVSIFTPDINTVKTDVQLPNTLIKSEQTVEQSCRSTDTRENPRGLTFKGKGGVPDLPTKPFNSDTLLVDEPITSTLQTQNPNIKPIKTSIGDIYPARGVIKTVDGKIILTAYTTDSINTRTPHISANCSLLKDEEDKTINN